MVHTSPNNTLKSSILAQYTLKCFLTTVLFNICVQYIEVCVWIYVSVTFFLSVKSKPFSVLVNSVLADIRD